MYNVRCTWYLSILVIFGIDKTALSALYRKGYHTYQKRDEKFTYLTANTPHSLSFTCTLTLKLGSLSFQTQMPFQSLKTLDPCVRKQNFHMQISIKKQINFHTYIHTHTHFVRLYKFSDLSLRMQILSICERMDFRVADIPFSCCSFYSNKMYTAWNRLSEMKGIRHTNYA